MHVHTEFSFAISCTRSELVDRNSNACFIVLLDNLVDRESILFSALQLAIRICNKIRYHVLLSLGQFVMDW